MKHEEEIELRRLLVEAGLTELDEIVGHVNRIATAAYRDGHEEGFAYAQVEFEDARMEGVA